MDDTEVETTIEFIINETPRWRVQLAPRTFYHVDPPCWFHRIMQRFLLGWKWERVE